MTLYVCSCKLNNLLLATYPEFQAVQLLVNINMKMYGCTLENFATTPTD